MRGLVERTPSGTDSVTKPKLAPTARRLKIVYVRKGPHPSPVEHMRLIFDARLPDSNTKLVLLNLASRLSNRLHYCFPSAEGIAEDTQLCRRTVLTALTTLLDAGYIRRKRRWGQSPLYWITWSALPSLEDCATAVKAREAGRAIDTVEGV